MTSTGVSDALIQKISNVVCESIKHDHDKECDLNCGHDSIPANFLKNHQYWKSGATFLQVITLILIMI